MAKGFKDSKGNFHPTENVETFGIPRRSTKRKSVSVGTGRRQEIQLARIKRNFPNDMPQPEPIGNISSLERMLAENEVKSPIEFVGFSDDVFEFDNKQEWWIFNNFEDAKEKAIDQQEFLLEQNSSIAEDMVQRYPDENFVFITETDIRIISSNDADNEASDRGLSETERDQLSDEIQAKLEENPVDYLVNEVGRTFDAVLNESFIRVDNEKIAEFIVNTDGVANTLSKNGREVIVLDKNGKKRLYMYRATP